MSAPVAAAPPIDPLARLAAAQRECQTLEARCSQLQSRLQDEREAKEWLHRQLNDAFGELEYSDPLGRGGGVGGGDGGAGPTEESAELLDNLADDVAMVEERLRTAKAMLKRQKEANEAVRSRRQLYEQSGVPLRPSRPPSAPAAPATPTGVPAGGGHHGWAASGGGRIGGGGTAGTAPLQLSTKQLDESIRRMHEDPARRRAERENRQAAAAAAEAAAVRTRRLGKEEQASVVARLEGYAVRRRERERSQLAAQEGEAVLAASGATSGAARPKRMGQNDESALIRRLHDTHRAEQLERLRRERADAAAADAMGAGRPRATVSGVQLRGLRSGDAPRTRAALMHGGHDARGRPAAATTTTAAQSIFLAPHGSGIANPRTHGATMAPRGPQAPSAERGGSCPQAVKDRRATAVEQVSSPIPALSTLDDSAASDGAAVRADGPRCEAAQYFELTVPDGYHGGDVLPVALPSGDEVIVTIPNGLGAGQDFVVALPVQG